MASASSPSFYVFPGWVAPVISVPTPRAGLAEAGSFCFALRPQALGSPGHKVCVSATKTSSCPREPSSALLAITFVSFSSDRQGGASVLFSEVIDISACQSGADAYLVSNKVQGPPGHLHHFLHRVKD